MAKFMTRRHGEVDIKLNHIKAFDNEKYNGLEIGWGNPNIGWGNCTFLFGSDESGDPKVVVESECMCGNDDKRFLKTLFEELIDLSDVVE